MSTPGKDGNNYPTNTGAAYQQTYGNPQQQGYFPQQQGGNNQQQQYQYSNSQQQQYAQQQQFQAQQYQQPNSAGYDANGLAQQLQNQHLNARQGNAPPGSPQRPRTSGSLQASGTVKDDYVVFQRDDSPFTSSTRERAKALKVKVELHYNQSVGYAVERNQRRVELEQELDAGKMSDERKKRRRQQLGKQESQFLRLRRMRLHADDFLTVKVIGKGAFGEVRLVQKRDTGKIYAMKTLLKSEMFKKDQLAHVKAERDVLADSDSPWVVNLFYSFQDAVYLYLIMEFLPGGDLMTMLIKYEIFTEDVTRFYMAQCVCAIEAVHRLGFIHRDIKPDNILIDKDGHIKLSDFGLSTGFHKTHDQNYYQRLLEGGSNTPSEQQNNTRARNSVMVDAIHLTVSNRNQINTWRKSRRLMAYSTVGTPDYIAPEIFLHNGYGQECDWWSLGTIMFECLVGWPPFCAEDAHETYRKIVNWQTQLYFPEEIQLSHEAEDLIRCLITSADKRLGRHGADEIKAHPFFDGVDWDSLRKIEAPFKPNLSSITDTSYFPTEELEGVPTAPAVAAVMAEQQSGSQPLAIGEETGLPFIGYTYKRFEHLTKHGGL